MKIPKSSIFVLFLIVSLTMTVSSCKNKPETRKKASSGVVSDKISKDINQQSPAPDTAKKESEKMQTETDKTSDLKTLSLKLADILKEKTIKHYNARGKIDPFKSLMQEKAEESAAIVDKGPKRILTPLEKIDLSQIRLVAVIILKNRKIAMVEEANGKGYEIGIGTYIGKNQGSVSEIRDDRIIVKEIIRDHKGRQKEKVQELKLHKTDHGG